MERLSLGALARATLARQMLLGERASGVSAVEAVGSLCGMQAQEPRPPFVGLWSRLEGFSRGELLSALMAGDVVRATLMRATLHLLSASDYAAFRAPLQPAIGGALRGIGDRAAGLRLEDMVPAARELFAERPRSFDEVRAELSSRFPEVDERALGFAVRLHLPLTMVPVGDERWGFPRASLFALSSFDDSAASPEPLIERYLAAFGPASVADFQTWSGLSGVKPVFDAMRARLVVFGGPEGRRELFDLPDAPRPGEGAEAPARFLPEFDNLVLAHADRSRFVDEVDRARIVTKNLRVRATFLWEGRVAGTWSVARKRRAAVLTLEPFSSLPRAARRALTDEGEGLLRFVEEDAETFEVVFAEP